MYEFRTIGVGKYEKLQRAKLVNDKPIPKWQADPACLLVPYLLTQGKEGWAIVGIGANTIYLQRPLPKQ